MRGSDPEVLRRYLQQASSFPVAVSGLLPDLTGMMLSDRWGWSWLDVDWSILVTGDGPPHSVIKLRNDLDMSTVTRSLGKYYTESGPADRPEYALDLTKAPPGLPFVAPVTVLPAKHLLVVGASPAPFLATIDGKAASMTTDPTVLALTTATGPAQYLMLRTGGRSCVQLPPLSVDQIKKLVGSHQLERPTALALAVVDERTDRVVARYPDPDTARADQTFRSALLTKGRSVVTNQPYADLVGPATVSQSGSNLVYDLRLHRRAEGQSRLSDDADARRAVGVVLSAR